MNDKEYRLIALDMDGTLLNSQKQISLKNIQMIKRAINLGKIVIFNTGRCPAELNEYFADLEEIQYLNCVSGALVYDRKNQKNIFNQFLPIQTVKELIEISMQEDSMIHLLTEQSIVQKDKIMMMNKYHMAIYQKMYQQVTTPMENLQEEYNADPFEVAKLNIYHIDSQARQRTRQRILAKQLAVEMVNTENTALEISTKGIDKGIGLEKLCQYLNIPMSKVIVVGDGDNDIGAIKKAGLKIAMGNANDTIKQLADVIVADNDHDGCAMAIEKYILT